MDRDTLQDDLDLILERSRDDELLGKWDWEPPLGTGAPAASSAAEPKETGTEASSEGASDPKDGPEDGLEDESEDEEEED